MHVYAHQRWIRMFQQRSLGFPKLETIQMSAAKCRDIGYIHTMECYTEMKMNNQQLHATIWMNLINIHWAKETRHQRVYTV